MQIVWSEEIKEALERVCAYAHKYRVDVTITFGADGDAELRVEPTYWDKDTADIPQTEREDKGTTKEEVKSKEKFDDCYHIIFDLNKYTLVVSEDKASLFRKDMTKITTEIGPFYSRYKGRSK